MKGKLMLAGSFMAILLTKADEGSPKGEHIEQLRHKVWAPEVALDYEGFYTLRDSEGPEYGLVVNFYQTEPGKNFLSIMAVSKDAFEQEPKYEKLGSFRADIETGVIENVAGQEKLTAVIVEPPPGATNDRFGLVFRGDVYTRRYKWGQAD